MNDQSILSPSALGQNWITENDPLYDADTIFVIFDSPHVDAAYKFIFGYLSKSPMKKRIYILMNHFCTRSATSFERFIKQLDILKACIPLPIALDTFHPEHVVDKKQSPIPILVMTWDDNIGDKVSENISDNNDEEKDSFQ